ncbi:MAG: DMT family transporter [candidate division Zixibacteria bacterium]
MNTLIYIFLCIVWGTTWLAMKIGLQEMPPLLGAFVRMLLAALILIIYNQITAQSLQGNWKDKLKIAWPGLFIYGVPYALIYYGMQYVNSGMAAIFFATLPLFVVPFVPLMVKSEIITFQSVIGVIIGFAGVIVIFNGSISLDENSILGAILLLIASSISGFFTVYLKAYLSKAPIAPMLAWHFAIGGTFLLLLSTATENWSGNYFNFTVIGSILYLTVFGSILGFAGFYWLIRRISTLKISMVAFITPITALIVGYLILNETLGLYDGLGSTLVLASILIVNHKKN